MNDPIIVTTRAEQKRLLTDVMFEVLGEFSTHHKELVETVRSSSKAALSAAEVGNILGCSARQVQEHHVPKGLRRHRPGRSDVFLLADVIDYVRSSPVPEDSAGEPAPEAPLREDSSTARKAAA